MILISLQLPTNSVLTSGIYKAVQPAQNKRKRPDLWNETLLTQSCGLCNSEQPQDCWAVLSTDLQVKDLFKRCFAGLAPPD